MMQMNNLLPGYFLDPSILFPNGQKIPDYGATGICVQPIDLVGSVLPCHGQFGKFPVIFRLNGNSLASRRDARYSTPSKLL